MKSVGIVWHQRDLRTEWNPALSAAAKEHDIVIPLFIYSEKDEKLGAASKWWLQKSLDTLSLTYKALGSPLILREGDYEKTLLAVVKKTGAEAVYWNIRFEPHFFKIQTHIEKTLQKHGIETIIYNGNHLIDPREIEVKLGKPYSVFTPFYKACLKTLDIPKKPPLPRKLHGLKGVKSTPLKLADKKPWIKKLEKHWKPGRKTGLLLLRTFIASRLKKYAHDRDLPAVQGTSNLSPFLQFGEISPYEVWTAAKRNETFRRQLLWREFGTYFLFHNPGAEKKNWNRKFDKFQWDKKKGLLKKWHEGKTGFPIIDAGMRQLWKTGWMHNRVRMIVASFLIKDLFQDWREGEKWFWDTLVDADKANNVLGWQWVAGSGPDAAPFFRIFNPILQGEKFDPDGRYIKEFLPELKNLPKKWLHHPWDAPEEILEEAGLTLGKDYPLPLVDHKKARAEALKRFKKIK